MKITLVLAAVVSLVFLACREAGSITRLSIRIRPEASLAQADSWPKIVRFLKDHLAREAGLSE
jgi:hypothetical protein